MGFGFNLLFVFIIVPLMGILLLAWVLTRKRIFGLVLGLTLLGLIGMFFLLTIFNWITTKKELKKKDYYGEHIIDRDFFSGKQTNWQYNSFRFEIKANDSMYFYVTDGKRILNTYRGTVTTNNIYRSERLVINMEEPTHHILSSNPTTYRSTWDYYLVFNSLKFNNVFFRKGKWQPLDK
jgi:hypothetical protein